MSPGYPSCRVRRVVWLSQPRGPRAPAGEGRQVEGLFPHSGQRYALSVSYSLVFLLFSLHSAACSASCESSTTLLRPCNFETNGFIFACFCISCGVQHTCRSETCPPGWKHNRMSDRTDKHLKIDSTCVDFLTQGMTADIWACIFKFCDVPTLHALRQSCRLFRDSITENIWKHILRQNGYDAEESVLPSYISYMRLADAQFWLSFMPPTTPEPPPFKDHLYFFAVGKSIPKVSCFSPSSLDFASPSLSLPVLLAQPVERLYKLLR